MRDLKEIEVEIATLQDELNNLHGTPTEVYARIVGYYRAVKNWNKGKRDEFDNRKTFSIELSSEPHIDNTQENFLGSCETEMFMLISTEFGSWGGLINLSLLPDALVVDYVRVYEEN